jgi:hypothetical protein
MAVERELVCQLSNVKFIKCGENELLALGRVTV